MVKAGAGHVEERRGGCPGVLGAYGSKVGGSWRRQLLAGRTPDPDHGHEIHRGLVCLPPSVEPSIPQGPVDSREPWCTGWSFALRMGETEAPPNQSSLLGRL